MTAGGGEVRRRDGDGESRDPVVETPGADPHALARALAGEGDRIVASERGPVRVEDGDGLRVEPDGEGIRIRTPPTGPVHDRVNPLVPGLALTVRTALAAAARTRGDGAPQDDAIRETREELAALDPDPVDAAAIRRRVADAGDREAELAERVAELRGRVRAREAAGLDAAETRDELEAAAADLSDARTDRIAAEQSLDEVRDQARRRRDRRERRLELEDRLGNLQREARAHLATHRWAEFRAAVEAVPGEATAGEDPGCYEGDPVTAALAVVRVADLGAPVVLACERFPDAATAAEVLDAPVIRV